MLTAPLQSGIIRYPDINISAKLSDLTLLNHIPLFKVIEDDLTLGRTLPTLLMGKVATVKMMVLPKITFS